MVTFDTNDLKTVSSTSPASSSTSSTQASPALAVAGSSSGTTSTTTAALSAAPKLPTDITGKTVEEEHSGKFRKHGNDVAERILQERDIVLRLESEVAKVFETRGTLEQKLELIVQLMADLGFSFSSTSSSSSPNSVLPLSSNLPLPVNPGHLQVEEHPVLPRVGRWVLPVHKGQHRLHIIRQLLYNLG